MALLKVGWVTKWAIAADSWSLLGLGAASKPNLDRLNVWVSAWAAEWEDLKPVIIRKPVQCVEKVSKRFSLPLLYSSGIGEAATAQRG